MACDTRFDTRKPGVWVKVPRRRRNHPEAGQC
jgi:hypothetical protein